MKRDTDLTHHFNTEGLASFCQVSYLLLYFSLQNIMARLINIKDPLYIEGGDQKHCDYLHVKICYWEKHFAANPLQNTPPRLFPNQFRKSSFMSIFSCPLESSGTKLVMSAILTGLWISELLSASAVRLCLQHFRFSLACFFSLPNFCYKPSPKSP